MSIITGLFISIISVINFIRTTPTHFHTNQNADRKDHCSTVNIKGKKLNVTSKLNEIFLLLLVEVVVLVLTEVLQLHQNACYYKCD